MAKEKYTPEEIMSKKEGKASDFRKKLADLWKESGHTGHLNFVGGSPAHIEGEIDGAKVDILSSSATINEKTISADIASKLFAKYWALANFGENEHYYAKEASEEITSRLAEQEEKESKKANEEVKKIAEKLLE